MNCYLSKAAARGGPRLRRHGRGPVRHRDNGSAAVPRGPWQPQPRPDTVRTAAADRALPGQEPRQRPTADGVLAEVGALQPTSNWLPELIIGAFARPDAGDTGAAVLSGVRSGCPVAVRFAAGYPDGIQSMVLADGFAKMTGWASSTSRPDRPGSMSGASGIARVRGPGVIFGARVPSTRDSTQYRDCAAPMERHTCSPGSGKTVETRIALAGRLVPWRPMQDPSARQPQRTLLFSSGHITAWSSVAALRTSGPDQ